MNIALEVKGLCKQYELFALRDVSFAVPEGYIMGFIGPNGSGKTTTMKSILGITDTDSGSVTIFGQDARAETARVNEDIGVVMDFPFYSEDWTARQVEEAVAPFYSRWDSAKFRGLLEQFSIDPRKPVKGLSRGMKVKLMLAVALSHEARLLVLDEPTSGLDPAARDEICTMLADFVTDEGHSVLFSSHITSDLEKIADYITLIMRGRVVCTGQTDEVLARFRLVRGGPGELTDEHKRLLLGLHEHATGFEGMVEAKNLGCLPGGLLVEPVNIEELMIYMEQGGDYCG